MYYCSYLKCRFGTQIGIIKQVTTKNWSYTNHCQKLKEWAKQNKKKKNVRSSSCLPRKQRQIEATKMKIVKTLYNEAIICGMSGPSADETEWMLHGGSVTSIGAQRVSLHIVSQSSNTVHEKSSFSNMMTISGKEQKCQKPILESPVSTIPDGHLSSS